MKVLFVFAHPEPKSLNGSIKDVAVNKLKTMGYEIKVSDLYRMEFKAVLDKKDFLNLANPQRFNPIAEQIHAVETNSFSNDIKEEIKKVKWADIIIFQFPIWYGSMPAIMKGWFERIFANGFSSNMFKGLVYDKGLMKGKKAMLSFTTGGPEENYLMNIPDKDPGKLLPTITESLKFSGFDLVEPFVIFNALGLSVEDAEKHFTRLEEHLSKLQNY